MRGFEDSVSYLGSVREGLFEGLRLSDIGGQLSQAALGWAEHLASCLRSYVLAHSRSVLKDIRRHVRPYAYTLKKRCVGYNEECRNTINGMQADGV